VYVLVGANFEKIKPPKAFHSRVWNSHKFPYQPDFWISGVLDSIISMLTWIPILKMQNFCFALVVAIFEFRNPEMGYKTTANIPTMN